MLHGLLFGQVHTHGVNWELWLAIVTPLLTAAGAAGRALLRALRKLDQVGTHLAAQDAHALLQDKLRIDYQREIAEQHDQLGAQVQAVSERIARLEGPIKQVAETVNGGTA